MKNSNEISRDRTSDLPICSTAPYIHNALSIYLPASVSLSIYIIEFYYDPSKMEINLALFKESARTAL